MTIAAPPALQRIGPFARLPALLEDLGAPTESVFAPFNIDPSALRPDSYLPLADCVASLEAAAKAAGCDHIGLLLGSRLTLADLQPLASLLRSAPTLKDALFDYVTWQPRYSNAAVAYLYATRGIWFWGYAAYDPMAIGSRHLYDLSVAAAVKILDELSEGAIKPCEIHLSYVKPARTSVFERILEVPVSFNQSQTCLVLTDEDMRFRIRSRDQKIRSELLSRFDDLLSSKSLTISGKLKHYMRVYILQKDASLDACADRLNVHPRTLRRRLASEDCSFEELAAEVKCTMACELLEMTDLPLSEISDVLDFSSQSNFSHAFKRWTGSPPKTWRKEHAKTDPRGFAT